MKAKKFLEKKLKELASKFEEVKIRYEYRANTQSHIIEIIPLVFFQENEIYLIEEANIESEFEARYPMENIIFISEGSLTEINNADIELGYNIITFDYNNFSIEFEVNGYYEVIEPQVNENYAIAA